MKIKNENNKLVVTDFDEIEAYIIACKVEEDGMHFYKKLRDAEKSPEILKAIDFLIKEEQKHWKTFNSRLYELRENSDNDYDENDLLTSVDYGIFKPYEDTEGLEKAINNEKRALSLGLIIENKSIEYYTVLSENISEEKAKSEIAKIIKEEKHHKELLEGLLKKIA
ncbi:MAG: ferritin family protein [Candidatus Omnitrophica bacterium]|nr:ferritin family protein [Candidatus Omnitrophota bacterium]